MRGQSFILALLSVLSLAATPMPSQQSIADKQVSCGAEPCPYLNAALSPEERAKDLTAPVGPLLENFAIGEVARQLTWAEEPVELFHYRDRDRVEVDMVLEHASGTVIGIEVKAAETVRGEDFRGLRHLANRLGDRFRAGIVLYAGEQQLSFGDRLTALPMAALWMLDSSVP